MPGAGGIRAGQAFVELFADDRRLVRGLRQAQRKLAAFGGFVRGLGAGFAALGAGIVAPLLAAARSFAQTGDDLDELAGRTGVSVEALSELGFAARLSGAGLADVEKGVRTLQRTIVAAAAGSDSAAAALARLGLSAADLQHLSPEQQFDAVAQALRRIENPTSRAAAAMSVLGRSGTQLLPMIDDLDQLRAQARALGVTLSTRQAKDAAGLADAFDRVAASLGGVVNAVGGALAPVLTDLANRVTSVLVGVHDWVARNQGLVVTILKVGAGAVLIGGSLVALGLAATVLATALGGLATIASAVGSVLGVVGAVLGALLTPIGAIIGGVVALGAVVLTQTQAGGQALGWLGERFAGLRDDASAAWTGIADALLAGDLTAATQVVWAALKLEWQRGTAFLADLWDSTVAGFATVFAEAWFGILGTFQGVVNAIGDAWDLVTGLIVKAWNTAVAAMAGKFAGLLEMLGLADAGLGAAIDQDTQRRNQEIDAGAARRQQERTQASADIATDREAVLAGIGDDLAAKQADREAGVGQARAELDAAVAAAGASRAATNRRAADAGVAPDAPTLPDFDALQASLDRVPETLTAEAAKLDVSGTFGATAVGQLGVGDTAGERTAKAAEETAKNTLRLLRAVEDGGAEFG